MADKSGGEFLEEEFCGVWGHLREEYLKAYKPELYKSLLATGEIEKYLNGYQQAYSNRADKMALVLAEERGVNDELYKKDAIHWVLESEKIQEEVNVALTKEIQQ